MSRPVQEKLNSAIRDMDLILSRHGDQERPPLMLPYKTAVALADEIKTAEHCADKIADFVALASKAFEAMDGLLANWPDTSVVTHYEPDPHRPVLMKEEAMLYLPNPRIGG